VDVRERERESDVDVVKRKKGCCIDDMDLWLLSPPPVCIRRRTVTLHPKVEVAH
jgi:hypothetical protein